MTQTIIPGVVLEVFEPQAIAVLTIAGVEIAFDWNEDSRNIFENIDTCESVELLSILATSEQFSRIA